MDIALNAADPTGPGIRPFPVNDHDTPILQTPNDNLQTLRDIAFDKSRHTFPPDTNELVPAQRLGQQLASAEEEGIDVLHDGREEPVIPVGEVGRQSLTLR